MWPRGTTPFRAVAFNEIQDFTIRVRVLNFKINIYLYFLGRWKVNTFTIIVSYYFAELFSKFLCDLILKNRPIMPVS